MYSNADIKLRELLHPILLLGVKLTRRLKIEMRNRDNIPDRPVIFAVNHSNAHDFPTVAQAIKKHFYILADFTMKKDMAVNILNVLNGCIYVDRKDKQSRIQSKDNMIDLLSKGKNILIFPEGTWNFEPDKLLLPFNWGIIDISLETNTPIVPITLGYSDKHCIANIGKPFYPDKTSHKSEEILVLRDIMGTLLWESIESFPKYKCIDYESEYKCFIEKALSTYKKLDYEYETSVIRKEYDTADEVFAHLNKLTPSSKTAFLYNKRNHF